MTDLPWNKRFRRLEFRPPYADPEEQVRFLREMDANSYMASAMDASTGFALYPSEKAPMCKLVDGDYLGRLIRLCHDSDIMVISWYDPRQNGVMYVEKPEWRMLVKESNDVAAHALPDSLCYINSPYKEWVYEHLEEIVHKLDFDGFLFDCSTFGSYDMAFGCYCDWCKMSFRSETGQEMPEKIEWGEPVSNLFVNWRYEQYNLWLTELRDRLQRIKSELILELNVLNRPHVKDIGRSFNWMSGIKLRTLPDGISAGSESDASIYRICSMNQAAAHARAMKRESWNLWMPAVNGSFDERPGACLFDESPTCETFKLLAAEAISKGGIPWYGVDLLTKARREKLKETFAFIRQREDNLGDVLITDVAIHMSNIARDYYGKQDVAVYFAGVLGFFEAVTELHYPVDFILDDQFTLENLKKYRVLILSNSACLTAAQVTSIGAYVQNGGVLVVTHFSSLMDENSYMMANFALKKILGVDFCGIRKISKGSGVIRYGNSMEDPTGVVSVLKNAPCVDVKIPANSLVKVMATISDYDCDFVPYFKAAVQNADYDELEIDTYFKMPHRSEQQPVIVRNAYGSGLAYYCGFDIGATYLKKPFPGTRIIINDLINERQDARIRLIAPKCIELSVLESCNGEKLHIHVVNAPATSTKSPGWHTLASVVDEILPIYGIVAEINGWRVSKAVYSSTGQNCEIEYSDSGSRVMFDCINLHEIILVE